MALVYILFFVLLVFGLVYGIRLFEAIIDYLNRH